MDFLTLACKWICMTQTLEQMVHVSMWNCKSWSSSGQIEIGTICAYERRAKQIAKLPIYCFYRATVCNLATRIFENVQQYFILYFWVAVVHVVTLYKQYLLLEPTTVHVLTSATPWSISWAKIAIPSSHQQSMAHAYNTFLGSLKTPTFRDNQESW